MAKQKVTKLIPNGIYKKNMGETIVFATCLSVNVKGNAIIGYLNCGGIADERLIEGTEDANSWKRVRKMSVHPIDLKELIEDIGEVIDTITGVVLGTVKAIDTIDDAVGNLKDVKVGVKDITQSGPMGPRIKK